MTGDPGDPGEPRTLQDPLAESLRVVDLATDRGLLVRLMGGMAIRAHAPDWPARTRRVEVDLDFATRGKDRGAFYELLARRGLHRGQAAQRAVRWQAGLLRRRAPEAGRSTSSSTASRCAIASSSPTGSRSRPRPCRSPSSSCRSSRSSRSIARTCSTRWSCWPSTRWPRTTARPTREPGQGAINVPRILSFTSNDWGWWRTVTGNLDTLDQYLAVELHAGGPRPRQRPVGAVRAGRPGRRPPGGHRRRPEVDALEAARAGR